MTESLQHLHSILFMHHRYRASTLNLIASENVMSPAVEKLLTPELSHRYGDYLGTDPRARKYTGNTHLADLDAGAQQAVQTLFGCRHADLRPLSGHVAGIAAILALCGPGDTVMELDAAGGGHRLAEKLSVAPLCPLRVLPVPMDPSTYNVDVERAVQLIARERPRLLILGSSLLLFPHPIAPLAEAVHAVGGHLLFDASHVLGLIAGRAYPNPLGEGADLISSSTHKTFAGPQGGLLMTNDSDLYEQVALAVYPALVTNHHLHRLPALWAVCEEWRQFGCDHARAVIGNAQALAAALAEEGVRTIGRSAGFTATHTVLIAEPDAPSAALGLESAGILVTPVKLPPELGGACLRLGVQEVTRLGMTAEDAPRVAALIAAALAGSRPAPDIAWSVADLVEPWDRCRFTWERTDAPCTF
jgi:glycine hydroxymethyltransferase